MKHYVKKTVVSMIALSTSAIIMSVEAQETFSFPSRSSDLPLGTYWVVSEFSEGCCTLDLNVEKWDGTSWRKNNGGSENDDDYSWNVPLYAPASGEVISCWRNSPDNPKIGKSNKLPQVDNPANANNGVKKTIFTGGNHVTILTDSGHKIGIAHLKQGSMPASLCPSNSGSVIEADVAKEGNWRVDAYIEPADRPRIEEGQYLGRVGNSGNSTGPHIHISTNEVVGTDSNGRPQLSSSNPLVFRQNWAHKYNKTTDHSSGGWYRLRGTDFTGNVECPSYQANAPECKFKMLHSSPYLRRADITAGPIKSASDTLFISGNRAVTGVIGKASGKLKLISWDLVGISKITRKGEILAGATSSIKLSEPKNNFIFAGLRQSDNALKMIAYKVSATGGFVRKAQYTAGKIKGLDMTTTRGLNKRVVTAVITESGDLKLIAWSMNLKNNGAVTIKRLGQKSAGAVSLVSIASASNFDGVYTAVRDSGGKLKVIPWKLSSDGMTFSRGADVSAGVIGSHIDVVSLSQGVAVAMQDGQGKLRVITWSANSSGDIIKRNGTAVAGAVHQLNLLESPNGGSNLTTVVRSNTGRLHIIGWLSDSDGDNLRRIGSTRAGNISALSSHVTSRSYTNSDPRDMVLSSVTLPNGNLKLISWDTNLVSP